MSAPDVLVVGGGVIGCSAARELARAGASVAVVERDQPGTHASWAAAGMLSPQAECDEPGPFLDLLRAARALFPDVARELREETGIDVAYRDVGTLLVALNDDDERHLEARCAWQTEAGLPVSRLGGEEARGLEPALSPAVRWALRFPEDHQVDNRRLARALWQAAASAGADFRTGREAVRLLTDGIRATGVELAGGERIEAGRVVLAAGSWAGRLRGLPRPLPVRPVHGQLLAVRTSPPLLEHVVDSPRCYLVPRLDGRLIAGATVEETGFRTAVTPAGLLHLLSSALEIVPSLSGAPVVETWSGLRPGTPDDLPILGPDPEMEGLIYAAGHYRNGILLAPLTGRLVADLALGRSPAADLSPFRPDRF